jgi:hypothetical protein
MNPADDFEAITGQLTEELTCVAVNPLSVIVDYAELVRDHGEQEALAMIARLRAVIG